MDKMDKDKNNEEFLGIRFSNYEIIAKYNYVATTSDCWKYLLYNSDSFIILAKFIYTGKNFENVFIYYNYADELKLVSKKNIINIFNSDRIVNYKLLIDEKNAKVKMDFTNEMSIYIAFPDDYKSNISSYLVKSHNQKK